MMIGERLRALREQKGLSQGDIERASGMRRCYISRVEHPNWASVHGGPKPCPLSSAWSRLPRAGWP